MSPDLLLGLLIAILVADAGLDAVARLLQLRHQPAEPPPELAGHVDAGRYERSQEYTRARTKLGFARSAVTLALWTLLLASGALAAGYAELQAWAGSEWLTPLLFFAGFGLLFDLVGLPFDLVATFGIEERFGFNRSTPALFVRDKLVGYALAVVLGGGLLALLLGSIELWGRDFWIPYALVIGVFLTFMAMFQTSILLPLFNKLTPLPEGELRDAIASYVEQAGFELEDTYVMDGSKRSTKANAFFAGLGRQKKVVLFDTLIERHPIDEVVAVVAHEVGHAKHRHLPKLLAGNLATVALTLFVLSLVLESRELSFALGAGEHVVALNLVVFVLLFSPVSTALGVVFHALSRRFEYQADAFAARTHARGAMANTLRRFVSDQLSVAVAHPLYAALHLSHPAPVDRIRAIERGGS